MLGCLVEKQLTTPQQYPLTLNALTMAVNQATNRDPVVTLEEDEVLAAVDELRGDHLVRVVLPSHGRSVKRYRQVLDEVWGLDAARYALLAVLLLRGPQTIGELRARTERMADFNSADAVQDELGVLAEPSESLVRLLPRRPGQKEDRWQQVLAAPWSADGADPGTGGDVRPSADRSGEDPSVAIGGSRLWTGDGVSGATSAASSDTGGHASADADGGIDALRAELASLRSEVADLREGLDALRRGLGG